MSAEEPIPAEWADYLREMHQEYDAIPPEERTKIAQELGMTLEEVFPSQAPEPEEKALRVINTAPELEVPDLFA